jgi:excisionase family DNA binding protein
MKKTAQKMAPALPDQERFLTKHEVAVRLGIRPRTVGVWAQQRRLPAYRVGRYLRFKWNEVEQFLASTCHAPGERRRS